MSDLDDMPGPVYPDGLAGHGPSDTSTESAESVTPRLREKQLLILRALLDAPSMEGRTAHELAAICGFPVQSVNSRTSELNKAGLIFDTKRRRMGPYGKSVIVWTAYASEVES